MADHYYHPKRPTITTTATSSAPLLQKLQEHVSNSMQLFGILTLVITGAILLLLTGLTVVATILGLILFAPLVIVLSPIWVPVCTVLFVFITGFLSTCRFGLVVLALFLWMFRYFRGLHPSGSDRVHDSNGHVKDY